MSLRKKNCITKFHEKTTKCIGSGKLSMEIWARKQSNTTLHSLTRQIYTYQINRSHCLFYSVYTVHTVQFVGYNAIATFGPTCHNFNLFSVDLVNYYCVSEST